MADTKTEPIERRTKTLLMCVRQAIIMILGGIEDFLDVERSIKRRKRR